MGICVAITLPSFALAQAWLPDAHSFSYSLSYANILNKKHYTSDGGELDLGSTRSDTIDLSVMYSPTDWMSVSAGIPYVLTKYSGNAAHRNPSGVGTVAIDDGSTHGTWTDFHAAVHFQAIDDVIALAPYFAVVIPVHDYTYMGHAAPGKNLNEFWAGFALGMSFDRWIPDTYTQVRYNYAFAEKVAGVSHDRSNLDIEIGYFITPLVSTRLLGKWQRTHGGIDVPIPITNPLYPHHDQLADDDHFNVGAALSWSFSPRMGVELLYMTSVWGYNSHKVDHGIFASFSFGTGGAH